MRPAATDFGSLAGYGPATPKPTSSSRRAWLYRASIAARKQIDSTPGCSNASSSAGCVVNQITATWQRFPTLAEEDAKRPNREREGIVRERTRIVNRMKSCLARFGVRNFNPTLRKAPERLATLVTPEGVPLPPNTLLELRRDMARLRSVMDTIKEFEEARAPRLDKDH